MNTCRTKLLFAFLLVIALVGLVSVFFGYQVIKRNVIKRAQGQVQNDLRAARSVLYGELEQMGKVFNLISVIDNPARLKTQLSLDYLFVVERSAKDSVKSAIVADAFKGNDGGGIRIIDSTELWNMNQELYRRSCIDIKKTPRARPAKKTRLTQAMSMEYAVPFYDGDGSVKRVLYGGKILNRYFGIIDKIHDIVYENRLYHSKPTGTVTIFQDDTRIATNVLAEEGERAIGTRVSAQVYKNVVETGNPWLDRAFVVTDWYLTAYEPIRDSRGSIIGILYVGILENPFNDMIRKTLFDYLLIIGIAAIFAAIVAYIMAGGISRPVRRLVNATHNLSTGDLAHRVQIDKSPSEIQSLAHSFNQMAQKLEEREQKLRTTNEQLGLLNSRYLDLVGLVTHELKGILSSVMLNACSVRDGHFGEVNELQKKAMKSVVRNLEYFDMTVKNFLNLSRLEKNEMTVKRSPVALKEEVIDVAVDSFMPQAKEKKMTVETHLPQGHIVHADPSLLLMVMNNLIGNAIKYGEDGGRIRIAMQTDHQATFIEVFNTGRPLTTDEIRRLFKRFSRLDCPETRKARGTGLGLFLCKETVEQHGGTMRCEPRENGNVFVFSLPTIMSDISDKKTVQKEYDYA